MNNKTDEQLYKEVEEFSNFYTQNQEFKEYFLSIIDYQYCRIINPIGSIYFYSNEGYYLMDYNLKNGYFWLSYKYIWSKLESRFGYNYKEIRELTKGILEEHYKFKGITTKTNFKPWGTVLEEHYKLKDITTF